MAKLSANGRTELLRMERYKEPSNLYSDTGSIEPTVRTHPGRHVGRKVLKNVQFIRTDGSRHQTGWKVFSKVKAGLDINNVLAALKIFWAGKGFVEVC